PFDTTVLQDAVLTRSDADTIHVHLYGNGYDDDDEVDVDLTYLSNDVWIRRYIDHDINAFKIWNDGDTEPASWTIELPGAPINITRPSLFAFYYGGDDFNHGGLTGGTTHLRYFEIVGSY